MRLLTFCVICEGINENSCIWEITQPIINQKKKDKNKKKEKNYINQESPPKKTNQENPRNNKIFQKRSRHLRKKMKN